jgi:hypothetical protein
VELTWWEWEEMQGAIEERHELWREHPERALTYFRMVDDIPVYALQAMPGPGRSEFRLVQVSGIPLTWAQSEVDEHLSMMRERFTSFPFRQEVEQFLLSEDVLRDPAKAHIVAIVIGRMQQAPVSEPMPAKIPFPHEERRFTLHEGGSIKFWRQGDMLRCYMELRRDGNLGPTSGSFILLDGHMRIRGTSMKRALEWLTGDLEIAEILRDPHAYARRRQDAESAERQSNLPLESQGGNEGSTASGPRSAGASNDRGGVLPEDGGLAGPATDHRAVGVFPPGEE